MQELDLDNLERLARAATPGRRFLEQDSDNQWNVYAEVPEGRSREWLPSNRDWLAIVPHQCVASIEEERARDAALFEATGPDVIIELVRLAKRSSGANEAAPPLVSILADAAEDATAMRIRELEERNEALVNRLAAIGASVARLPPFDANDGDTYTSAPRIDAAADLITDMQYRIDEYERIAQGAGRDLATMERLRNEAEATAAALRSDLDEQANRLAGLEESLQDLASDAFGPLPLQTSAEHLSTIEKGIEGLVKQVRDAKLTAARELGSKGGTARAAALSPRRRRQIAKAGGKAKAARKAKPTRSRR